MTTKHLNIKSHMNPPYWALLERQLISSQTQAIEQYYEKYFDHRGYLMCVPRWGGDDGPDDAAENFLNWPVLHAIGSNDVVLDLYKKAWDGHLLQYTEAKTIEVPMGRDGMYFKEFPVMFDWMHHGEWLNAFVLQGLSDPKDPNYIRRMKTYSGFYMGEDPIAKNWDDKLGLIKSMFNGSRGPLLRKATGLDWAGDDIELEGRFKPNHKETSYEMMVEHFDPYTDVAGDHPLNLSATVLALNAFALTGEAKYRDWILRYIDNWVQWTEQNNGIVPTNIGLDGTLGGECNGNWYGGVYGWNFTVWDPAAKQMAHRPSFQSRTPWGFANALLMTGDMKYVRIWGDMIDQVHTHSKEINGKTQYPHMYGNYEDNEGWYAYSEERFSEGMGGQNHPGTRLVAYCTMEEKDLQRVSSDPWIKFLKGSNQNYPESALIEDLAKVRERMAEVFADSSSPDTRMSDDMNFTNPAATDSLIQLMLGGLPTGREGAPLHCRLRYFDPENQRAGIPEDVSALVTSMDKENTSVTLINLNPSKHKTLIIQGGAYAEHHIINASSNGESIDVEDSSFRVNLNPGCGSTISIKMSRYKNLPSFSMPWD